MSKSEKFLLNLADAARLCNAFRGLRMSMRVDTWIRPRRSIGVELYRSQMGSQDMPKGEITLVVTYLESRAGPSLLGCEGVGQAAANFPPPAFCFQLCGWPGGVSSLPNTRPHSPPKINILYRHLALLLCSPHGALCHWLGLILGFLKHHIWLNPTMALPGAFPYSENSHSPLALFSRIF